MKPNPRLIVGLAVGLMLAAAAPADISMTVVPSSAPNASSGSPSWAGYVTNALYALENGISTVGDRNTDPTAYTVAPAVVLGGELMVTSFNSWRGVAFPGAPFANEYGNRMHFGLHLVGDGSTQFRINDLTFNLYSSDSTNTLGFAGNFVGYAYNNRCFGVNWGTDRVKGGGDDTYYYSGNSNTFVDEIVYVGVGNAWWPGYGNPTAGQADINDVNAWIAAVGPIDVTCDYTMYAPDGSTVLATGSAMVTAVVPAPAAVLLGVMGLSAVTQLRRRLS